MACNSSSSSGSPLKTQDVEYGPNSVLLLTVDYPNNSLNNEDLLDNSITESPPGFEAITEQDENAIAALNAESVLDCNSSDIANQDSDGVQQIEICDKDSSYPLLLLQNDISQEEEIVQANIDDTRSVFNHFLFASLNKNDICEKEETNSGNPGNEEIKKPITSSNEHLLQELHTGPSPNLQSTGFELETYSSCSDDEEIINKVILDKPVTCRARATLPAKFLYIDSTTKQRVKKPDYGIFAKQNLPKRTLFGPMEGLLIDNSQPGTLKDFQLLIETDGVFKKLDVSNENLCNWMRYVRPAASLEEQNLIVYQHGKNLYFSTLRSIKPGDELKVWYSSNYARLRSLPCYIKPKAVRTSMWISHPGGSKILQAPTVKDKEEETREWTCSRCNCSFNSATLLNLHVLTHAADNIETEGIVLNDSPEDVIIEDQFIQCLGTTKQQICAICSQTFASNAAFVSHMKTHAPAKKLDCPICKITFEKILELKDHIHIHCENGAYSCPHCAKKFPTYKHIRCHIRTYHSSRKYVCEICSKCFPTTNKLKMHQLSHSEHRKFSCASCGDLFKRKDKLTEHIKRMHINGVNKNSSQKVKTVKKVVQRKVVESADYRDFIHKCHICIVGFKRRGMLVNHLVNAHSDISPESVPELNVPILKDNKDYFCQYCEKKYKSSTKRKKHILKNHPGKELPLQGKGRSSLSNYSQTVGSVTMNPHSCQWCYRQYASKAKLLQHQRKNHLNLLPKSLQIPKKPNTNHSEDDIDAMRDEIGKDASDIFLHNPLETNISEYELAMGDSRSFNEGEYIIDASTLKKTVKEEVMAWDCSPETISELGQMIDNRPDQYFKVYQTSSGITFARPVEVWDPLSACQTLGPSDSNMSSSLLN